MEGLNKEQTSQLIFITLSALEHNINHCISNIDVLMANEFIAGIEIRGVTGTTTIGKMMEAQRNYLSSIGTFFSQAEKNLYYADRENLPKNKI